jgi:hypothetical protein
MEIGLLPLVVASWWCLVAVAQPQAPSTQGKVGPSPLFSVEQVVGTYSLARGIRLTIKADHSFLFTRHNCLQELDRNSGTWGLEGDVLVLQPAKPYEQLAFRGIELRYVPVPWGERVYLVDENGMAGFAAAAGGADLAQLRFSFADYVQVSANTARAKAPHGKPLLPERYLPFHDHGPVNTMVIELRTDGTVVLDKGSKDRLRKGLMLAGKSRSPDLQVLEVHETSSVARPFYFFKNENPISVGDEFTTGTAQTRPRGTGSRRYSQPPSPDDPT